MAGVPADVSASCGADRRPAFVRLCTRYGGLHPGRWRRAPSGRQLCTRRGGLHPGRWLSAQIRPVPPPLRVQTPEPGAAPPRIPDVPPPRRVQTPAAGAVMPRFQTHPGPHRRGRPRSWTRRTPETPTRRQASRSLHPLPRIWSRLARYAPNTSTTVSWHWGVRPAAHAASTGPNTSLPPMVNVVTSTSLVGRRSPLPPAGVPPPGPAVRRPRRGRPRWHRPGRCCAVGACRTWPAPAGVEHDVRPASSWFETSPEYAANGHPGRCVGEASRHM